MSYNNYGGGTGIPSIMMRYPLVGVATVCTGLAFAGGDESRKVVSFTFDDAKLSVLENLIPTFDRHRITGTIFANSLENRSLDTFMTVEDMKGLHEDGWEIGNHTATHPDLTQVGEHTLFREVVGPLVEFIPSIIGTREDVGFAAPYGAFGDREVSVIAQHHAYNVRAWVSTFNDLTNLELFNLHRYSLDVREDLTENPLEVCQMVLDAPDNSWFVFMGHNIVSGQEDIPFEDYAQNKEFYEDLIVCLKKNGVEIRNVIDVVKERS